MSDGLGKQERCSSSRRSLSVQTRRACEWRESVPLFHSLLALMVTLDHRPSTDFVHPIMHSLYCYPGNNSNGPVIDWDLKLFFLERILAHLVGNVLIGRLWARWRKGWCLFSHEWVGEGIIVITWNCGSECHWSRGQSSRTLSELTGESSDVPREP